MAVVRSGGLAMVRAVAKVALASGAKRLAVASPEEGSELRQAGIAAPVVVLGALLPGQSDVFCEYRLTAPVASQEAVAEVVSCAQRRGQAIRVHVKVDTGMGRLGFPPEEVPAVVPHWQMDGVALEGIYSHLACADSEQDDVTPRQVEAFRGVLAACERAGTHPESVHLANTAATLRHISVPECNLVRVGLGLYGPLSIIHARGCGPLYPALELKTRVTTVKRVPAQLRGQLRTCVPHRQ